MKDLIDERNQQEQMKKSIIKFWNVNYIDLETLLRMKEEEDLKTAQEIVNRLESEKAADDAEKEAEIQRAKEEAMLAESYNPTTGSYSGAYGMCEVDEVNREQIDKILQEKNVAFKEMLEKEI